MLAAAIRNFAQKHALGIEIGGQTAAFAISDKLGDLLYKKKGIPTRVPITPEEAKDNIVRAIKESGYEIGTIGIATFGPVDIYRGKIAKTPKPAWGGYPIQAKIQAEFPEAKVVIDTDVNAPAYSEYLALKQKNPGVRSVAYATIGTGCGVGIFCDGKPLHGRMHPECGHFKPQRVKGDDFPGVCPFHGDCIEGLIAAPAIAARLGIKPNELATIPNDHIVWDYFAEYAGQLCASLALAYSLDAFVVGGGIVTAPGREYLIENIRKVTKRQLNGYIEEPEVILPAFGSDAGLVGATALALNPEIFEN